MNISLLEPIGIDESLIYKFGETVEALGHQFGYYSIKTKNLDELIAQSKIRKL